MFRLIHRPLPHPGGEDLPAQDRATWAALRIELDGVCLTQHTEAEEGNEVHGPLAGLAEWVVECWPWILWEAHTPFPKPSGSVAGSAAIPTLGDAARFWQSMVPIDSGALGAWQHRHTLGHGTSDVAVPPLLFVSDVQHIGVFATEFPPELDPSVRLLVPQTLRRAPAWVSRDDLAFALKSFVEAVLELARGDAQAQGWSEWLAREFDAIQIESQARENRRRWLLGPAAAECWHVIEQSYGGLADGIEGVAIDSKEFKSQKELTTTAELLRPRSRRRREGEWYSVASDSALPDRRPFEQGYALAHRVRDSLKRPRGPLDLVETLQRLDIELSEAPATEHFRSAVVHDDTGRARIVFSGDYFREAGLAPRNFAIAAALGRLLAAGGRANGASFGAAHGTQSRWRATQMANAFAAELHAPVGDVRSLASPRDLVERYGLSSSASEWHFENRRREDTWAPPN